MQGTQATTAQLAHELRETARPAHPPPAAPSPARRSRSSPCWAAWTARGPRASAISPPPSACARSRWRRRSATSRTPASSRAARTPTTAGASFVELTPAGLETLHATRARREDWLTQTLDRELERRRARAAAPGARAARPRRRRLSARRRRLAPAVRSVGGPLVVAGEGAEGLGHRRVGLRGLPVAASSSGAKSALACWTAPSSSWRRSSSAPAATALTVTLAFVTSSAPGAPGALEALDDGLHALRPLGVRLAREGDGELAALTSAEAQSIDACGCSFFATRGSIRAGRAALRRCQPTSCSARRFHSALSARHSSSVRVRFQ